MKPVPLAPGVFATGQIAAPDIAAIAAQGFRSIINNRPDGEESGQPRSQDLEAAATSQGLAFVHVPIVPANVTPEDVDAFDRACKSVEKPVLLFCRSGARCAMLWQMNHPDE